MSQVMMSIVLHRIVHDLHSKLSMVLDHSCTLLLPRNRCSGSLSDWSRFPLRLGLGGIRDSYLILTVNTFACVTASNALPEAVTILFLASTLFTIARRRRSWSSRVLLKRARVSLLNSQDCLHSLRRVFVGVATIATLAHPSTNFLQY
jgi:hypothetical protein